MITGWWTCPWARRRLQRYRDADPAAALSPVEIRRLEAHLAICASCAAVAEEYRALRRALASSGLTPTRT